MYIFGHVSKAIPGSHGVVQYRYIDCGHVLAALQLRLRIQLVAVTVKTAVLAVSQYWTRSQSCHYNDAVYLEQTYSATWWPGVACRFLLLFGLTETNK